MSSTPSQSQANVDETICPQCGAKNAAAKVLCTSCGTKLGPQDMEDANSSQQPSFNIGEVIIGALALGALGYAVWKGLRTPEPKPEPETGQTLAPPPRQAQPSEYAREQVVRPRPQPGEHVEGWVIGGITAQSIPRRLIKAGGEVEAFEVNTMPPLYVGSIPIYPPHKVRYSSPIYAPPTTRFVFAIFAYPSGPISKWGDVPWNDVDILWHSEEYLDKRNSLGDEPEETPELRAMVDSLVQRAVMDGWEQLEHGTAWCNYRFRKGYDQVGVSLKWK